MHRVSRGTMNAPGRLDLFSNFRPAASITDVTRGNLILYILAAIAIVVIVLILMRVRINWSSLNPLPLDMQVKGRGKVVWEPATTKAFTNLTLPAESTTPINDSEYSMMIDMMLLDTRNYKTADSPHRHILHRGSGELHTTTVGGAVLNGCPAAASGSGTSNNGLPRRMNPGILLDPNTNDLLIFVDTMGTEGEAYRESVRIADIPLNTPFRLQIVISGNVFEAYINCKLEVTKVLQGKPKTVENAWYGVSGSAAGQVQIQNLYIWNESLQAEDIRSLCKGLPVFGKPRPTCDGSSAPVDTTTTAGTTGATQIDLGFGANIKTCTS